MIKKTVIYLVVISSMSATASLIFASNPTTKLKIVIDNPKHEESIELICQKKKYFFFTINKSWYFNVEGSLFNKAVNKNLYLYVFAKVEHPPSPNWWLQKEADMGNNGKWNALVWTGDKKYPRKIGDEISLRAVVLSKKYKGKEYVDTLSRIPSLEAISNIVRIKVGHILNQ